MLSWNDLIAVVSNVLAMAMCVELVRRGYLRCVAVFVAIQWLQLLEIPLLRWAEHAVPAMPSYSNVAAYRAYYRAWQRWHDIWLVCDKLNLPLEIAATVSISRKGKFAGGCAIAWVGWLMILHMGLKEWHYAPVTTDLDLRADWVYYARTFVNIAIEVGVLATIWLRPAVTPPKENQSCRTNRKRRLMPPPDLLQKILAVCQASLERIPNLSRRTGRLTQEPSRR